SSHPSSLLPPIFSTLSEPDTERNADITFSSLTSSVDLSVSSTIVDLSKWRPNERCETYPPLSYYYRSLICARSQLKWRNIKLAKSNEQTTHNL
ncbi:hypothetical protein PENTCL1PPCAC_8982, partial [Pristionchus entomophagus]